MVRGIIIVRINNIFVKVDDGIIFQFDCVNASFFFLLFLKDVCPLFQSFHLITKD